MRKKFAHNRGGILDYELLELLMFSVLPRKDTKKIAKDLLQRFGSLREVIFTKYSDLKSVEGIGDVAATLLNVIHEILNRIYLEKISESSIISSSSHVIDYYKTAFANTKQEQLRIMFLNNKNRLLAEEILQVGTINQMAIYPREIMHRALDRGASAIIMVHNHPSGDPQPSKQDVITTKMVKDIAQKLDIMLLDHIIIGKNSSKSLKELGMI
jgi:DNA repair protein RadC